ncbi:MAG TPA: thioredoxin domain-containing protein [Balneolaceae bacterium]|nr:thioredoxin domain-containing protein [Balneolaceae bacterium]
MKKLSTIIFLGAAFFVTSAAFNSVKAQEDSTENETIHITEYSDYQCPACAYYHPFVKKLKEDLGDKIEVTQHFFPLRSHRYGAISARAAQAARNQGKFIEMHNLLFENQQEWASSANPTAIFVDYARRLGLDIEQFKEDLNSGETQRIVMESRREGIRRGVQATPTFFIEGEKVRRLPRTYEGFKALVLTYINQNEEG